MAEASAGAQRAHCFYCEQRKYEQHRRGEGCIYRCYDVFSAQYQLDSYDCRDTHCGGSHGSSDDDLCIKPEVRPNIPAEDQQETRAITTLPNPPRARQRPSVV